MRTAFGAWSLSAAILAFAAGLALAQSDTPVQTLTIPGHAGEATVIKHQGRSYVDLLQLIELAQGSLAVEGNQLLLTFPGSSSAHTSPHRPDAPPMKVTGAEFSHTFMRAAIEEFASMREWASTLASVLENGYPISQHSIDHYREQTAHNLRLAKASVSTEADKSALGLLVNEFDALSAWSDKLLQEHKSMDTAKYSMSENAVQELPLSQKIVTCGHFLATMLGSGTFQDDASCH